jgi:HD-GYP domain-containing protein (c-di-GMP phosphodiesterase class II)
MTDRRPYRRAVSWDAAVAEIKNCRGSHFDPDVVDSLDICEPDLYRIHTRQAAA